MKLIWTKSTLPLSKLIRYGLNEPVSHFGIVFDNGIVFHSNLLGTHIEWYGTFKKHCEIVFEIDYPMELLEEEKVYRNILDTYDDMGYDFGAFLYFCYRASLYRVLGTSLPTKNEWAKSDKFLCTELARVIPNNMLPAEVKNEDLSIISPYSLYLQIKNSNV